jgi:hypothetical protein
MLATQKARGHCARIISMAIDQWKGPIFYHVMYSGSKRASKILRQSRTPISTLLFKLGPRSYCVFEVWDTTGMPDVACSMHPTASDCPDDITMMGMIQSFPGPPGYII